MKKEGKAGAPDTVDAYIRRFPEAARAPLKEMRALIRKAAPGAVETLKYDMPCYMLSGKNLVYFAGYGKHTGFYGAPTGIPEFAKAMAAYKTGRGSIQFPLDKPLPSALITRMVKHRVKAMKAALVIKAAKTKAAPKARTKSK